MNITYLIGNGFDINLNLETKYSEFYKFYLKILTDEPLIKKMKSDLESDIENWSDLESALGEYLACISSLEEMDILIDDLCEKLSSYLEKQEQKISLDNLDKQIFINNLIYPENCLLPEDNRTLKRFKDKFSNHSNCNINIVTFNYTRIIESLLNFNGTRLPFFRSGNTEFALNEILHIHGTLDDGIILGVNDLSQFHCEKLKTNNDALETIIKPARNKALKILIDERTTETISSSDLIILFGLSLGDTDKIWWELIAKTLLSRQNTMLLIFFKGKNFSKNEKHKMSRKVKLLKEHFISKTGLPQEHIKIIWERIFIGYNTNMFNIIMKEETIR